MVKYLFPVIVADHRTSNAGAHIRELGFRRMGGAAAVAAVPIPGKTGLPGMGLSMGGRL